MADDIPLMGTDQADAFLSRPLMPALQSKVDATGKAFQRNRARMLALLERPARARRVAQRIGESIRPWPR
jgi:hypothetical protein